MKDIRKPYHLALTVISTSGEYLTLCNKWVYDRELVGKHMTYDGYICYDCRKELEAMANEPPTEPLT